MLAHIGDTAQPPVTLYCVCQKDEEEGRYIACSTLAPKKCPCNGWVHADCVGKGELSDIALKALNNYLCPPCTQKTLKRKSK